MLTRCRQQPIRLEVDAFMDAELSTRSITPGHTVQLH